MLIIIIDGRLDRVGAGQAFPVVPLPSCNSEVKLSKVGSSGSSVRKSDEA
jgi:hypothetical protein